MNSVWLCGACAKLAAFPEKRESLVCEHGWANRLESLNKIGKHFALVNKRDPKWSSSADATSRCASCGVDGEIEGAHNPQFVSNTFAVLYQFEVLSGDGQNEFTEVKEMVSHTDPLGTVRAAIGRRGQLSDDEITAQIEEFGDHK